MNETEVRLLTPGENRHVAGTKTNQIMDNSNLSLTSYNEEQQRFIAVCEQAQQLQLAEDFGAAFRAVSVTQALTNILSDKFMQDNIMPLMNRSIGFLTDRTGRPNSRGQVQPKYDVETVRDAFIDAVSFGLLPTGNQFNIIAGRMYPTKEGFSALLSKLGVKYQISIALEPATMEGFSNLLCTISYSYRGEKQSYKLPVQVKSDQYSTPDQLKGKAERRAKKNLYEYLTGLDLGEGDAESAEERIVDEQPQPEPEVAQKANVASVEERKAALRARQQATVQRTTVDYATGEQTEDDVPQFDMFGGQE